MERLNIIYIVTQLFQFTYVILAEKSLGYVRIYMLSENRILTVSLTNTSQMQVGENQLIAFHVLLWTYWRNGLEPSLLKRAGTEHKMVSP